MFWVFYYGTQTIVALNQVGGSEGFGEVPVDTAKLSAEDAAIAVAVGGTDVAAADVYKALITYVEEDSSIYVTFMNGEEIVDTIAIVDGKAVLPETTPTLAASAGYVATSYAFVEWVDADGNAVTADTAIDAATTVYAKFKSNLIYGDVTGDGQILAQDRTFIHAYIKSNGATAQFQVMKPVSEYLESTVVAGDVTSDGQILAQDRTFVHAYIKSNGATAQRDTSKNYYVINK